MLILDTNILPKIISGQDSPRVDQIFSKWVKALCVGISPPPKGKVVTIAASSGMINDYKTGLRRCRYSKVAKTLKMIFNRSVSDVVETGGPGGVRLMLEKVAPRRSVSSMRVRDPYDQEFLDVVFHVVESKRWKDRKILFATEDQKLVQDAERALVSRNSKRVYIADNMNVFGELFKC